MGRVCAMWKIPCFCHCWNLLGLIAVVDRIRGRMLYLWMSWCRSLGAGRRGHGGSYYSGVGDPMVDVLFHYVAKGLFL